MKPVQEEELSALLDGALDPERASQVRAGIAQDPELRRQFDALAGLDARLRSSAEQTVFAPDIRFPRASAKPVRSWQWPAVFAGVLALLIARALPKLVELLWFGAGVHVALCVVVACVVFRMVREPARSDAISLERGIPA